MDLSLLETLNGYAARHDSFFEDPLRFVSVEAPVLFIVLLAALFLANGNLASRNAPIARRRRLLGRARAGHRPGRQPPVARPRPYVAHPGDVHLFIPASMDTSFPSDHATAAFAIAVAIFLRSRRAGWIALAMATLVSVGRVVVGTHYPTDVLAGAAIGTLSALVFFHPRVRAPAPRAGRSRRRDLRRRRAQAAADRLGGGGAQSARLAERHAHAVVAAERRRVLARAPARGRRAAPEPRAAPSRRRAPRPRRCDSPSAPRGRTCTAARCRAAVRGARRAGGSPHRRGGPRRCPRRRRCGGTAARR